MLFINDLPECLRKITPCLYADDTQIFASSFDYAQLIDNLNYDLKLVNGSLEINYNITPTKTKVMVIGSTHNLRNKVFDPTDILNGKFISRTKSLECLGVLLDEKLSWDEHICKKVGAAIDVMKRVKPFVPPDSLQIIIIHYTAML